MHQNSSSLQLATKDCESCHSHLSKYFCHPHLDISLFLLKLKEYQNMIYVKLGSVTIPATVTNKASHLLKDW